MLSFSVMGGCHGNRSAFIETLEEKTVLTAEYFGLRSRRSGSVAGISSISAVSP
jgi:hypothetical protein